MRQANLKSWLIWLTAGIFYLYEFVHRVLISVMVPELMQDFNVSVATLGSLSACYFYAYALAQIPVGALIDRYGTRSLLTGACFLIGAASFIFSQTTNMLLAEFCRAIIGFGSAFAFVGCLKLGSVWFPARQFGFIVGLTNLLGVTGAIVGGKPVAYLVDLGGWRAVMILSSIIGLGLSACLWVIIRDHYAHSTAPLKSETKRALRKFILVLKCRQTWLIAIFGGFMVAPITTYSELWGVAYLVNNYHIDRPTAAQITSLTFLGIAIGGPTIGWFSDYLRIRKLPMIIGLCGAALCLISIIYLPKVSISTLYSLHFLFGLFTSSMLLCFTLIAEDTVPSIRATTIALTNTIIMAMGAIMQTLSGYIIALNINNFMRGFLPLLFCYAIAVWCWKYIKPCDPA